jgi:hypothetical protein
MNEKWEEELVDKYGSKMSLWFQTELVNFIRPLLLQAKSEAYCQGFKEGSAGKAIREMNKELHK